VSDPVLPTSHPTWRDRLDLIAAPVGMAPVHIAGAVVGLAVALVAAWLLLRQPAGPPPEASMARAGRSAAVAGAATSTTPPKQVVVHAAGAVVAPGVYSLVAGTRVDDLLKAAGGAAPDADLNRIDLAALLVDGTQVYVPRVGVAVPATATGGVGPSAPAVPLDLNTATLDQLDALPGIGPATAKAILAERDKRGRFTSVDDLLDVRGIGPAKLDAIRDLVTV
jgi:competence protein ComEA